MECKRPALPPNKEKTGHVDPGSSSCSSEVSGIANHTQAIGSARLRSRPSGVGSGAVDSVGTGSGFCDVISVESSVASPFCAQIWLRDCTAALIAFLVVYPHMVLGGGRNGPLKSRTSQTVEPDEADSGPDGVARTEAWRGRPRLC